jgi:16S rRNA processing protein RimM
LSEQKEKAGAARREILHVGQIGRAHGLQGEVRVMLLSSDPDRLARLSDCLLVSADERAVKPAHIESVRPANGLFLVKLQGIDDRTQAEHLNGQYLSVGRDQAITLPPGQWFVCDLVQCKVYDSREGYLGDLRDIIQGSAHDIYVVSLPGQPDLLFPARKIILRNVDLESRRIDVELPEGLYEVYRERKH